MRLEAARPIVPPLLSYQRTLRARVDRCKATHQAIYNLGRPCRPPTCPPKLECLGGLCADQLSPSRSFRFAALGNQNGYGRCTARDKADIRWNVFQADPYWYALRQPYPTEGGVDVGERVPAGAPLPIFNSGCNAFNRPVKVSIDSHEVYNRPIPDSD